MYEDTGNLIQAADPGVLIIAEGISQCGNHYGYDLNGVATNPVTLNNPNKVVSSVQECPKEIGAQPVDSGRAYLDGMKASWGFLVEGNIAPVWIGEMGSNMSSADSQAWAATLLPYLSGKDGAQGRATFTAGQQPVSDCWWSAGAVGDPTRNNPSGNQTAWGLGNYVPAQQVITGQMLFKP